MKKRSNLGFTILELLVAITLFAIGSTLAYRIFAGGIKLSNRLKVSLREETSANLLFAKAEKDLKNAVLFDNVPFRGDNFAMRFATLDGQVRQVRYDHEFSIEYAYQDKDGEIIFQPYWTAMTLPKAVRLSKGRLSTLVVLPQGQIGKPSQ